MTPWERLESELVRKRKSLSALAKSLGVTKQALGHWKTRGIPAKYLRPAAAFVGRPLEWLEFDDLNEAHAVVSEPENAPTTAWAIDLGAQLDSLSSLDARRAAYLECSGIIQRAKAAESQSSAPNQSSIRRA